MVYLRKTFQILVILGLFNLFYIACDNPATVTPPIIISSVAINIGTPINGGTPSVMASTTDTGYPKFPPQKLTYN